jgi:hypothetical protein
MNKPYDLKRITPNVYGERKRVKGKIVALLHISFNDRGLKLIGTKSRTVRLNEIHELMLTDEEKACPGGSADRVRALAFFEIIEPGLIVFGDKVYINGEYVGILVGYDETHMPNHMNIVLKSKNLVEPKIKVGDILIFKSS